ncbi:nucleoprotein TPR-like [Glandiceps talaboti]
MAANVEFARLCAILSSDELNTLPDELRSKLEAVFSSKETAYDGLKAQHERLKVNAEQQYFEIEKQLISSNSKLESLAKECTELKTENTTLENERKTSEEKLKGLEVTKEDDLSTQLKLTRANDQLESEKREYVELLQKKNHEIERLNEEWSNLSDKLAAANTAKVQAQAKLDEILGEDVTTKYREKRLQQEKELLNQQNGWLNKELKLKTNELLALRKESSTEILQLRSELENKRDEVKHLQETVTSLKGTNDTQSSRIEAHILKIKDVQDENAQREEQFRAELQAQTKLSNLYKSLLDESKKSETELQSAMAEMQKLLKEASDDQNVTELKLKSVEELNTSKQKDLEEQIDKMEKELEHANDLLAIARRKGIAPLSEDDLVSLSPTAAAASSLLKSGMTLTQMYSAYIESSDALELEKQENRRLNQYLDQILKEIEEKAPVMQKQREDYEKSIQTIDHLSSRLDTAMLECEKLRINSDESERKASQGTRENNRLRQQTADLGQQVRILLKEVETARSGHVSRVHSESNLSSSDVSSSSQIITEKLVPFRNIEELQEQNQQLLGVVRELSEKKEEEERITRDGEFAELNDRLGKALEEIDELRTARNRQAEMVEGIVRQRDMYRVLLAQKGDTPITPMPLLVSGSPSPLAMSTPAQASQISPASMATDSTAAIEAKAALGQLQAEFENYKKEKGESEKMLNEQLDKMREELSEFRVQNAKLSSQLEFSAERFKILQSNTEGYKKEIQGVKDKNQKYSADIIKHQQTINTLTHEMLATQEKLAKAEVSSENLTAERDILKNVEARLLQEKESIIREQRGQNILLTNLQTIQNNLERADFENKARLTSQIELLERELNAARRKLDSDGEQHKAVINSWESQVKALRDQLDSELMNHQKTREEVANMKTTLQGVKQECSAAEAKLAAAEVRLANVSKDQQQVMVSTEPTSTTATDEEVKELKSQNAQYEQDIKDLKEQLNKAKQHVEQYKSISSAIEESLREQNKASQIFKNTTESRLKEAAETKGKLERQIVTLEKEKRDLINEKMNLQHAVETQTADLRKNLATLQSDLKTALDKCSQAQSSEQLARKDCQQQAKIAAESQDKYEREFLLHAADVQQLVVVKEQLTGFNAKLTESEEKAKRAEDELTTSKASWEERFRIQKSEIDQIQSRSSELNKQNNALHEQIEAVSAQLVAFQQKGKQSIADVSFSEENKSSEQLLEIIRFIRREKDIAEAKCEVAQAESIRHKQKCEHLEKQLEETHGNLQEERERSQVSAKAAAQHQDLMQKIETLNVLTDSNKLLREEKDKLEQEHQQLESKVKQLETDVTPLQEQNRELSNKNVALMAEKDSLLGEVKRWKSRTNHLIEQSSKADPEEFKKLVEERESNKKNIAQLSEENQRQKAAISRLNSLVTNFQSEIKNFKSEAAKMNEELQNAKKEVESKNTEMEEKNKTIQQVKKIGRRYKSQYEELKKQYDEKQAGEQQPTTTAADTAALEAAVKSKDEQIQKQTEDLNKINADVAKLKEDNTKLKEAEEAVKTQLTEKDEKTKKLLMNARQKITQLTGQRDRQNAECEELKNKVSSAEKEKDEKEKQASAMKSQYDRVSQQFEQQLKEAKEEIEQLKQSQKEELEKKQKELEELERLRQKVQDLQKQTEEQQKQLAEAQQQQQQQQQQPPQQAVPATERPSTTREEPPPTANIKPMATPSGSAVTKPTASAGALKVTASIRPMAISPATVSQTPTATVIPTTIDSPSSMNQAESTQESSEQPMETPVVIIMPSPVQAVQPTQQTPPISEPQPQPQAQPEPTPTPEQEPTQEPVTQHQAEPVTQHQPEPVTQHQAESVTQHQAQPVTQHQAEPETQQPELDIVQEQQVEPEVPTPPVQIIITQPTPTESEPTPTATTSTAVTAPVSIKRPREEAESEQEADERSAARSGEKKQRLDTEDVVEQETEPVAEVEPVVEETSESQEQNQVEQSSEVQQQEPVTQAVSGEEAVTETAPPVVQEGEDDGDDDVIVLDSDPEEQDVREEEGQWQVVREEEEGEEEGGYEGEEEDEAYEEEEYDEGITDAVHGAEIYEVEDYDDEAQMEEGGEEEEEMEEQMDDGEQEQQMEEEEEVVEIIDPDDENGDEQDQVAMEAQSGDQNEEQPAPDNGQQGRQPPQIQIHVVPPEPEQQQQQLQQQQQQQTPPQQPSPQQSTPEAAAQVPTQRLPMRTERLPSLGRQLPTFSFVGQGSGVPFEDMGDDCRVPSTPTLFVPKRTDGFAEALNSPQIQQVRFQFNPPEEGARQGLAQLATQGALGMDDTQVEILGEEDGGGRSVPTTPYQSHSPVVQFPSSESSADTQEESSQSVPVSVIETATTSETTTDVIATEHASESTVPVVEEECLEGDGEDTTQDESGQGDTVLELEGEDGASDSPAPSAAIEETPVPPAGQPSTESGETSTGNDASTQESSSTEGGTKPKPTLKRIVWSDSNTGGASQGASTSSGPVAASRPAGHHPAGRPGYHHHSSGTGRRFLRRPMSRGSGRGATPRAIRGGRGRGGHM